MSRRDSILVSRTLYQLGVLTLVTAITWIGIGIYTTISKPLNVNVEKELLEPINSNIDQEVIKALTGRLKVEDFIVIEPTPEPTTEPASGSATIVEEVVQP